MGTEHFTSKFVLNKDVNIFLAIYIMCKQTTDLQIHENKIG